ncbi:response regulator FixJ [Sinorhizobium prairiense]|uniref:response regulator FixJ n=1 Tax=unclassified Sinorhizobium TaxID=2613772 RepID=UPI0023D863FD|nr:MULTISPECIES: response regulator FixJ [unclassified Sinorhizobium]WEJ08674.1 response regulator FixJ [Sinorhizobium sp. M103]WEJ13824.1 response regulator FixJ [Sinorhizobium sp. K101]WEJ35423.1 response regulator FixJ [Sinorhizobium sp. C101]
MTDYTVHIVDDEEPVRKSLAFMLTMNGYAVKVHESAASFLDFAPNIREGILLTDLRMPDMSGVSLIRKLGNQKIKMPAIVITGHGDVPMAVEAMKAGALDFIEKPFEDSLIVEAIERASEHLTTPAVAAEITDVQARLDTLSVRERQVLSAVVSGLANKTIAYDLDISPRTVEVHRANVMSKMRAKSLPHLVRMAIAAGFGSS